MTIDPKACDVFRPRFDPAQTIYDAFQDEATKRKGRSFEEWHEAEKSVVWKAARDEAQKRNAPVPSMLDVENAERYASGSVDYGAKWAYALARMITEKQ